MAKLILDGFKSRAQAEEYAIWFSEQGEQDAFNWMDINEEESVVTDCDKEPILTKNSITIFVK